MLIEIQMVEFVNKGQELMLRAALQRLRQAYPDASFAMAPSVLAPYHGRARLGLGQKAWYWGCGIQWGDLAALAPARLREYYGVVLDREVDVVVNAAGYLYCDHWGPRPAEELARACRRWHRRGTRIILLPQAFGPFTSSRLRQAMRTIADHADLIFARDPISHVHLAEIVEDRQQLRIAPDFTGLIDGIAPENIELPAHSYSIIPNCRMIDKTRGSTREAYLPFMIRVVQHLKERGVSPLLLAHSGPTDLELARQIDAACGGVPIIKEDHPLRIKGILGKCEGCIGDRFHGLVSALHQGIPALAAGWSHKYQMLFDTYGFSEGLLDPADSDDVMRNRLDMLLDPMSRNRIRSLLIENALKVDQQAEAMWQTVFRTLDKGSRDRALDKA
jgi:colanic acid/amylovoran biosynthesis protein